jgi:hypothetical protein
MTNSITRWLAGALGAAALLLAAPAGAAGVPVVIGHQGRLFDAAGNPVTSTLGVTFSLYANASDTAPIWQETQTIAFTNGYFSATLGSSTALTTSVFNGSSLYLGVKVGADPEMAPRALVASVPYAMMAGEVTGDIHPRTVNIGAKQVIDNAGNWTGNAIGVAGPTGPIGPIGPTGPAGPAGPTIAYGYVTAAGTKSSGGTNWSCTWNATASQYEIAITGENYFYSSYTATVTPTDGGAGGMVIPGTSSVGGKLVVIFRKTDGTAVQAPFGFGFVVAK